MIRSGNKRVQNFIKGVSISNKYDYEDPTYLGFKVLFNFYDSPLFNETAGSSDSAINYLKNVNRKTESNLLIRFKNVLRAISTDYDYMLQGITGLGQINTFTYGQNFRAKDLVLTFDCLESIDQKMIYLMDCYLKGAYDWRYMRSLIPYNLQFFSMTLMIYEIRDFRKVVETAANETVVSNENGLTRSIPSSSIIQSNASARLAGNLPTQIYTFDYCTFDFNDSSKYLDVVSNAEINSEVKFQFKVKVGRIREKLEFPLFGTIIEPLLINSTHNFKLESDTTPGLGRMSDVNAESLTSLYGTTEKNSSSADIDSSNGAGGAAADKNFKDRAAERIKSEFKANADILKNQADNLTSQVAGLPKNIGNQIVNNVFSRIKGATLGNVYDFRNQPVTSTLLSLADSAGIPDLGKTFNQSLDKVFKPNGRQIGDIRAEDIKKKSNPPKDLGNVYK